MTRSRGVARWLPALAVAAAGAAAATTVVVAGPGVEPPHRAPVDAAPASDPWRPALPPGRVLVANERSRDSDPRTRSSLDWSVTSGSLFADDGAWWSGPVDSGPPDLLSRVSTGSAVLRAVSTRTFGDVCMAFDLRIEAMTSTERTPPRAYDGVHVLVRYRDPFTFYAVSVARRDGMLVIKKKLVDTPADGGDAYSTLASVWGGARVGERVRVEVRVRDVATGVGIRVLLDDVPMLDIVDDGSDGRAPLRGPGRVGVRADNSEIRMWDLVVTP